MQLTLIDDDFEDYKHLQDKNDCDKSFDGADYDDNLDYDRLKTQHDKIFNLMKDSKWRSLLSIEIETDAPQASISACLRDFRKPKHGLHTVNKRRVKGKEKQGWYEYQLIVRNDNDN